MAFDKDNLATHSQDTFGNQQDPPRVSSMLPIDGAIRDNIIKDVQNLGVNKLSTGEIDLFGKEFIEKLKSFLNDQDKNSNEIKDKIESTIDTITSQDNPSDSSAEESIEAVIDSIDSESIDTESKPIEYGKTSTFTDKIMNVLNIKNIITQSVMKTIFSIKSIIDGNSEQFKQSLNEQLTRNLPDVAKPIEESADKKLIDELSDKNDNSDSADNSIEFKDDDNTSLSKEADEELDNKDSSNKTVENVKFASDELSTSQKKLDLLRKKKLLELDKTAQSINKSLEKIIDLEEDVVEEYTPRSKEKSEEDSMSDKIKDGEKSSDDRNIFGNTDDNGFDIGDWTSVLRNIKFKGFGKKLGTGLLIGTAATLLISFRGYSSHSSLERYVAKQKEKNSQQLSSELKAEADYGIRQISKAEEEREKAEQAISDSDAKIDIAAATLEDAYKKLDSEDQTVQPQSQPPQPKQQSEQTDQSDLSQLETAATQTDNLLDQTANYEQEENQYLDDAISMANRSDIEMQNSAKDIQTDISNLESHVAESESTIKNVIETNGQQQNQENPQPIGETPTNEPTDESSIEENTSEVRRMMDSKIKDDSKSEEISKQTKTIQKHIDDHSDFIDKAQEKLEEAKKSMDERSEDVANNTDKNTDKAKETQEKAEKESKSAKKELDKKNDADPNKVDEASKKNEESLKKRDKEAQSKTVPKKELEESNAAAAEASKSIEESNQTVNKNESETDKSADDTAKTSKKKMEESSTSDDTNDSVKKAKADAEKDANKAHDNKNESIPDDAKDVKDKSDKETNADSKEETKDKSKEKQSESDKLILLISSNIDKIYKEAKTLESIDFSNYDRPVTDEYKKFMKKFGFLSNLSTTYLSLEGIFKKIKSVNLSDIISSINEIKGKKLDKEASDSQKTLDNLDNTLDESHETISNESEKNLDEAETSEENIKNAETVQAKTAKTEIDATINEIPDAEIKTAPNSESEINSSINEMDETITDTLKDAEDNVSDKSKPVEPTNEDFRSLNVDIINRPESSKSIDEIQKFVDESLGARNIEDYFSINENADLITRTLFDEINSRGTEDNKNYVKIDINSLQALLYYIKATRNKLADIVSKQSKKQNIPEITNAIRSMSL